MVSPLATGMYVGLGTAAAAGLAVGAFAAASRLPSSRIFGRALIAPFKPGELALTFDDGPNAQWTPRLLEVLAKYDVRATFFLLGSRAQAEPELVKRMAAAGHVIGNHSWSHPNLAQTSADLVREELTRTSEILQQITGSKVKFFRPPFGARRPATFRIARKMGLQPVLWNAMTADWSEPSAERIAEQLTIMIERQWKRGRAANIVMHDGGHDHPRANRGPSVAGAEMLLQKYKGAKKFVTLDEWS